MFRNIALHRFARGTTGEAKVSSRIHFAGLLLVRVSHGLWPRYRRPLTRRGAALYRSVRRPSARSWCKRRNESCCKIKRSQPSAAPTGLHPSCRSCRRLRSWRYQIHKTFNVLPAKKLKKRAWGLIPKPSKGERCLVPRPGERCYKFASAQALSGTRRGAIMFSGRRMSASMASSSRPSSRTSSSTPRPLSRAIRAMRVAFL